jgi:hypothetical protein
MGWWVDTMKFSRNKFSAIVLLMGVIALVMFSFSLYLHALADAQNAIDGHEQCFQLVRDLQGFRNAPRIASLEVEPPDRIAARVTAAASDAQLSPASILTVDPQSPVRVGRTDYQIRATQIVLQNASLAQVAVFVSGLEEVSEGMIVRDLSLNRSTTQAENGIELWNVRLTLTQMIFSPISGK